LLDLTMGSCDRVDHASMLKSRGVDRIVAEPDV